MDEKMLRRTLAALADEERPTESIDLWPAIAERAGKVAPHNPIKEVMDSAMNENGTEQHVRGGMPLLMPALTLALVVVILVVLVGALSAGGIGFGSGNAPAPTVTPSSFIPTAVPEVGIVEWLTATPVIPPTPTVVTGGTIMPTVPPPATPTPGPIPTASPVPNRLDPTFAPGTRDDAPLVMFGEDIGIVGWERGVDAVQIILTLRWMAFADIDTDYMVFVHLLDEGGGLVMQLDLRPRRGTLPTDTWIADTVIPDSISLPLANVSPGRYQLLFGLYDAATGERLPVIDPETGDVISEAVDTGLVDVP